MIHCPNLTNDNRCQVASHMAECSVQASSSGCRACTECSCSAPAGARCDSSVAVIDFADDNAAKGRKFEFFRRISLPEKRAFLSSSRNPNLHLASRRPICPRSCSTPEGCHSALAGTSAVFGSIPLPKFRRGSGKARSRRKIFWSA